MYPQPTLWDYRVVALGGAPQDIEAQLKRLGAEGWELVTTSAQRGWTEVAVVGIFKRPLVAAPPGGWPPAR